MPGVADRGFFARLLRSILPGWKSGVRFAVLMAMIWFFHDYARDHWDEFSVITRVGMTRLIPILLLHGSVVLVNALLFRVQCSCIDLRISFIEAVSTTVAVALGNTFLPFRGGLGLRVAYFKAVHGTDLLHLIAVTSGNTIIVFGMNALLCLPLLVRFSLTDSWLDETLAIIPATVLAGAALVMVVPVERLLKFPWGRLNDLFARAAAGWRAFRTCRRALTRGACLAALNALLTGGILYLELIALHVVEPSLDFTWLGRSLIIALMGSFSLLIGITPAALGIRESLTMVTAGALGLSPGLMLAACVLDRIAGLIVTSATGIPSYLFLTSRSRSARVPRESRRGDAN